MQGLCAEAPLKYIYIIYFYIMIYIIDNSIYQGRYHVQGEYIMHKDFDKTRQGQASHNSIPVCDADGFSRWICKIVNVNK